MSSDAWATAYRGSRALVLGGSGFIGRWVARRLTSAEAVVCVAVRDTREFARIAQSWGIHASVVAIDALDEGALTNAVIETAPDVVFNMIGYGVDRSETDPALMWRINQDLVRHVALALSRTKPDAKWGGSRLVHVGSALEYGLVEGTVSEDGTTKPHTEYGRSKLAGTSALAQVAVSEGLAAVTARAFTVFGPGEHPGRLLPTIRRAAVEGTTVSLSAGTQQRDFCYVDDVAEGLLRLAASKGKPGEVVNLASGRMTSVRTFAETAARAMSLPAERLTFGAEQIRDDEMKISGVSVTRLRARTGWTPAAPLEDGIRRALGFEDRLAGDLPQGA